MLTMQKCTLSTPQIHSIKLNEDCILQTGKSRETSAVHEGQSSFTAEYETLAASP